MSKISQKFSLSLTVGVVLAMSSIGTVSAQGNPNASGNVGTRNFSPDQLQEVNAGAPQEVSAADTNAKAVYIVRLEEPSVATYRGDIPGLKGTSRSVTGERKLNTKSKAAKKYKNFLKDRQREVHGKGADKIGRKADFKFDYQFAFNGFAIELTAKEARAYASLEGVAAVTRETFETMSTDNGPAWIGAPTIWDNGHAGSRGEGAVVAIFDSGINHDHPSFADIGGDGYDHENPLGSGNYLPGSYCDDVDPAFCNDKLIGAWDMVQDDEDPGAPEDNDGHGSHTASTAAGNVVIGATIEAPTASLSRDVSGVAPHANIIAYDVCIDSCPQAALLAAVDQVVIDSGELPNGIASLNYSISGGTNPYNDPIEIGFRAAADAGIYVATSAGNSGPDAETVAHRSPWLASTAATTHDRQITNAVIQLTSNGDALDDIYGVGFTGALESRPIVNSADFEGAFEGATLCGVGDPDGEDTNPFPDNHFNGEIVACTRGDYGRVQKGENVLAAGAGGYILMDNGGGLSGDAHVLPAVHISESDSAILAAWLANSENTMAAIAGFEVDEHPDNGDVTAGFSSRGPNTTIDVLKPDVGAPGVDIMAAIHTDGEIASPEFDFISGTSMASPHNAGVGALMSLLHPDWSPHQIRSAVMMTATNENTVKEDGTTPADPHDIGAGRIDLTKAGDAGLLLDESTFNFRAANPDLGGDPSTLNIASMMDSNCVGKCSWARTFGGATNDNMVWNVTSTTPDGAGLKLNPNSQIVMKKGKTKEVRFEADTTYADTGWNYAEIQLTPQGGDSAPLHLPVAVYVTPATNGNLFSKTVDASSAESGDILNYELSVINGPLEGIISLQDKEPKGAKFVPGSATATVVNGTTIQDVAINGQFLTWSGELDKGGIEVISDPYPPAGSPFGWVPVPDYGVPPLECSEECDETSITLDGLPPFEFDGKIYTSLIMGSNGIIIPGSDGSTDGSWFNQDLPDPTQPNAIAPFWTDLDLDGTGDSDPGAGQMYAAVFGNSGGGSVTILEWHGVEEWDVPGPTYTFQIQIGNEDGNSQGIWFLYRELQSVPNYLTVGAENLTGTSGSNYYFDGAGTFPIEGDLGDLKVNELIGGTATINVQMEANCSVEAIVNEATVSAGSQSERAVAVTRCE
jgi:hypothetical protein